MGLGAVGIGLPYYDVFAGKDKLLSKAIPKSGERLPVIGMGTWITFNVGAIQSLRDQRTQVLKKFLTAGGTVIDSSPMYGSAEEVLGYAINKLGVQNKIFAATKVWTSSGSEGRQQVEDSFKLWGLNKMELQQVHNLVNWREHLDYLLDLKKKKQIRYVGITTSHGRRHRDFESVMKSHDIDFVQLTYNIDNRVVESRLLPLAKEKKIAVIVNRPFGGGTVIDRVKAKPLPPWSRDMGCKNWADILLKYIVSHPAVTVAIPATSKVEHMTENMQALQGRFLTTKERKQVEAYVAAM